MLVHTGVLTKPDDMNLSDSNDFRVHVHIYFSVILHSSREKFMHHGRDY